MSKNKALRQIKAKSSLSPSDGNYNQELGRCFGPLFFTQQLFQIKKSPKNVLIYFFFLIYLTQGCSSVSSVFSSIGFD